MVKRRPLKGFDDTSSSSDEEDAFASLTKKGKKRSLSLPPDEDTANHQDTNNKDTSSLPVTDTSSNKRHHHLSAARKSKMDAMLHELQSTQPTTTTTELSSSHSAEVDYGCIDDEAAYSYSYGRPNKMGSYVEPGQEHLTTNIFVGNLDPCTTEEELTDVFREFGDLYSVKIMWPRTAEERARNRNTGFVCFMHRKDAEDAMDAYCDSDPLETGRRMRLTWGKNVKKTVQFGTGGVPTHFRKKPRSGKKIEGLGLTSAQRSAMEKEQQISESDQSDKLGQANLQSSGQPQVGKNALSLRPAGPVYDPSQHAATAIIVNAPPDPRRMRFITTIASFVAKDGSVLEQKLIEQESHNPDFQFLMPNDDGDNERIAEHIFYRWRVYAFAQGDGMNSWRTTPFVMFQPSGRFWIPPKINMEEAQKEEEDEKRREQSRIVAQEERRKMTNDRDHHIMTGRQIERATGRDKRGAIRLNDWEKETFHKLLREQLCATQDSICEAMAFAFDKSGAAVEIAELLKEALLESSNGISVDTRIARLYLLSDILFNSQQPGVKNAFQYRDAIESMSPEVFESLGKHGNGKAGRLTMNRLKNAVSSVLSAWTNWSVYNTNFLDLLECRFEGREYIPPQSQKCDTQHADDSLHNKAESTPGEQGTTANEAQPVVSTVPKGAWTTSQPIVGDDLDGEVLDDDNDGIGDPLDDTPLDKKDTCGVSTVPRGQWTAANVVDGSSVDGKSLDGDSLDEEELNDLDGESLSEEDIDGDALDDGGVLN